jgi:hypothetical protein
MQIAPTEALARIDENVVKKTSMDISAAGWAKSSAEMALASSLRTLEI